MTLQRTIVLDMCYKDRPHEYFYFENITDVHEFIEHAITTNQKNIRAFRAHYQDEGEIQGYIPNNRSGYGILNGDPSGYECYITNTYKDFPKLY